MKKILICILALVLCFGLVACKKKEKEKKITIESSIEGGYGMELKETIIIGPDGKPVEPFEPISEDAIVKTVDEITNLNELLSVFESCYNGVYTAEYDTSTTLASDSEYYLVTNYNSVAEVRAALLNTFANEGLINIVWKYDGFKEEGGKLYYRPNKGDKVKFTSKDATINYSNDEACELSVPMLDKSNKNIGVYNIEFMKVEETFIISYLTE